MSEEPIVLRNRNRYKSFQFSLYHAIVCRDGKCYCGKQAKMGRDERGEFTRAETAVFIPPRGQSAPLPASVLKIPQVAKALAEPGYIERVGVLVEVQVLRAPVAAPAPTFTAAPQHKTSGTKVGPKGR